MHHWRRQLHEDKRRVNILQPNLHLDSSNVLRPSHRLEPIVQPHGLQL